MKRRVTGSHVLRQLLWAEAERLAETTGDQDGSEIGLPHVGTAVTGKRAHADSHPGNDRQ